MLKASSPVTTSKWLWWTFLLLAPVLAFLLLRFGAVALPIGLVITAIPVYVTRRLLQDQWRTQRLVMLLYIALVAAAVIIAFTDPDKKTAMYLPTWISSVLGFYFMAAPLLITACVLVELHRVRFQH